MIRDSDRIPMLEPYTAKLVVSALSETEDYNHSMLNVPEMWKRSKGAGVKVAVLDTGCPQHIDLKIAGAKNFSGANDMYDHAGHSSHVCGIIGAMVNGIGVRGIAPECALYCGKVLGDDGSGTIEAIVNGIYWAVDEVGADVINMSLGCPPAGAYNASMRKACSYARSKGAVLCCAAGNDAGAVNSPANLESTIAVAAVDRSKKKAYFTCHGSEVDFAAGGVDVFSTWLNNQYAKLSGTSMATPVITGAVALIIGAAKSEGLTLTPCNVYDELTKIAIDVEADGKDEFTGNGIPVFASKDAGAVHDTSEKCCGGPNWLVRLFLYIRGLFSK